MNVSYPVEFKLVLHFYIALEAQMNGVNFTCNMSLNSKGLASLLTRVFQKLLRHGEVLATFANSLIYHG